MSDYAIKVTNLNKVYKLYDKPTLRFKEALSITKKQYHKDFVALNDISFEIKKGEMLGIIGKNGAGKSTVLKIITGVLTPTSGKVEINGKISALLELGAGFNPEYTGLENVYLNGTMIGFTREEMDNKIDDIISFADIGDFINQPVKTYSSGMFARLAFAVAINVEPDILIVDEALSVGDVFFQAKCYKKLEDLKNSGKTILFVTHDMGSVMKYCNRAIIFNHGSIVAEGEPADMIDIYKKILVGQFDGEQKENDVADNEAVSSDVDALINKETPTEMMDSAKKRKQQNITNWKEYMLINPNSQIYGDKRAEIIDFGIFDDEGQVTNTVYKFKDFSLKMKIKFNETIENPIFAFSFKDIKGTELTGTNTIIEKVDTGTVKKGQVVEIEFKQNMILQGGQYLLLLGCTGYEKDNLVVYNRLYDICCVNVISDRTTVGYFDMNSKVTYNK
ncbi:MAG: ABC transporter ATP-binding protein [Lachnospiraceae bacterium]|nr:ABC transporter ATP-binding protein [Clostridiales bacterium]MDD6292971.1 ABC transporter ATP-binding protein [Eubacteriales bacterium]MDY2607038.1 ABC transporter ATP-binding protein [Lachnospiraceae bacterium]